MSLIAHGLMITIPYYKSRIVINSWTFPLTLQQSVGTHNFLEPGQILLSHRAKRQAEFAAIRPIRCRAVLTGMGLLSRNMARFTGISSICRRRASAVSPRSRRLHMAATLAGNTLEVTEITPLPPTLKVGRAVKSSPDNRMNSSPHNSATSEIWARLPVASLDAHPHGAVRGTCGPLWPGNTVGAGAAGHVINKQGQIHGVVNSLEVAEQPFLRGFVVIGRNEQSGIGPGLFGEGGQAYGLGRVVGPGPGHDGDTAFDLLDADAHGFFVFLVGHSGGFAVVPQGSRPSIPCSICHSMRAR